MKQESSIPNFEYAIRKERHKVRCRYGHLCLVDCRHRNEHTKCTGTPKRCKWPGARCQKQPVDRRISGRLFDQDSRGMSYKKGPLGKGDWGWMT